MLKLRHAQGDDLRMTINKGAETDGKAAERAAFREECLRQWHFLPVDRQAKIERDPLCREANAFYDGVEREFERKRADWLADSN
jgi:hypothetical protein